jgi:hypothetical protein
VPVDDVLREQPPGLVCEDKTNAAQIGRIPLGGFGTWLVPELAISGKFWTVLGDSDGNRKSLLENA